MKKSKYNFDNPVSFRLAACKIAKFVKQSIMLFHKSVVLFLLIINSIILVHASDTNEDDAANRVDGVSVIRLEISANRADAARKRAVDFESPDYFPSEWDAADSLYTAASDMPKIPRNLQQMAAMFDNAADSFDEIFMKTIPLYAQAREDEIITAREKLISAGFRKYFPGYLKDADDKALFALILFETGDYYDARDIAVDALNEYETLYTGARILQVRREIIERDLVKYDAYNFDKADEAAQTANIEYLAGNKKSAVINAEDALRRYDNVLANGLRAYAGEIRN
jgi:hypothetical protein